MKIRIKIVYVVSLTAILFTGCDRDDFLVDDFLDDHFYLRNAGADMPVTVQGNFKDKTLVLFLQGGPLGGSQILAYSSIFNRLEKEFAVAYWDQRATGESKGNFSKDLLIRDQYVDDLDKLVKLIQHRYGKDTKIFLMGISWGGMLGTSYLIRHHGNHPVKGWIEINGGHDWPLIRRTSYLKLRSIADQQISIGNSINEWTQLKEVADKFDTSRIDLDYVVEYYQHVLKAEKILEKDGVVSYSVEVDKPWKAFFNSPTNSLTSIFGDILARPNSHVWSHLMTDTYVSDNLSLINIPYLFLWGDMDIRVPDTLAYRAYEKISTPEADKKLVIFPNTMHELPGYAPEQFYLEVVSFINKHN
ncbi:MAG: alpha/beta hydrolase [Cyclobacteriaceae bacterium]|nr:alpha/beta hydrolase [Cyclobacteriaceae bacterium]